jgi:hypothetical protein
MTLLRIYVGTSVRMEHPFFTLFLLIGGYLVYKMCEWFYYKFKITQQQCIGSIFIWVICFMYSINLMQLENIYNTYETTHTRNVIIMFGSLFFGWLIPYSIFSLYNKFKQTQLL